jgi:hypothetical protein
LAYQNLRVKYDALEFSDGLAASNVAKLAWREPISANADIAYEHASNVTGGGALDRDR